SGMSVDTDTFLKLLVAQLQYQDPLEPQTDTAFVTQLAQMTSLEQMQQMNSSLSNSQAYEMIGKYIYAEVIDSTSGITECYLGLVDSVIIREGIPYVVMGNSAIAVSDVQRIFDDSVFETAEQTETVDAADTENTTETEAATEAVDAGEAAENGTEDPSAGTSDTISM
ncbi:MAG: hypothetical protein EOM14_10935, partial [Clostridia bacterium]|nr:hypothetical protein [Clostridia bacterium]